MGSKSSQITSSKNNLTERHFWADPHPYGREIYTSLLRLQRDNDTTYDIFFFNWDPDIFPFYNKFLKNVKKMFNRTYN